MDDIRDNLMDYDLNTVDLCKIVIVRSFYLSYYIFLWISLGKTLSLFPDDFSRTAIIVGGVFCIFIYVVLQGNLALLTIKKR